MRHYTPRVAGTGKRESGHPALSHQQPEQHGDQADEGGRAAKNGKTEKEPDEPLVRQGDVSEQRLFLSEGAAGSECAKPLCTGTGSRGDWDRHKGYDDFVVDCEEPGRPADSQLQCQEESRSFLAGRRVAALPRTSESRTPTRCRRMTARQAPFLSRGGRELRPAPENG